MPFETKHHLSNIDSEARRADCSLCGEDIYIEFRNKKFLCCATRKYSTGSNSKLDLTYQQVDELKKNAICAICGITPDTKRNAHVDHDHQTGKFRDILCRKCNNGLGFFMDDPDLLWSALLYLEKHGKERTTT